MAYLSFPDLGGAAAAHDQAPIADAIPSKEDRLSALEWSVVALARNDRLGTLRQPGRLGRIMRAVFRQTNPMLADQRLEALRRMAVLTWHHGYTVATRELQAFLAAGFTASQYETMVDRVSIARVPRSRTPLA